MNVKAYAKINWYLYVKGKRPDGYHDLDMIMQHIDLHDDLYIENLSDNELRLGITGSDALSTSDDNLIIKAARLLQTRSGTTQGAYIRLGKRIPIGAGLGGGSADAAAVLRALRELVSPTLTDERLEQISASVGSDVPFCIRGGTQLAEGRGEKLTVLKPAPRFFVAVCKPDFPISTPALFARVDGVTITDRPDTDAMLAAIEHGDADTLCANVRNVFEQALDGEQRERIETIKCDLLAYGAKTSAMTGSGSVVFGLFSDKAACRRACEALQGECVKTFCAEFV